MYLYPQLHRSPETEALVRELSGMSIIECRKHRALKHNSATFSTTGGIPVSSAHLIQLREVLDKVAIENGYSKPLIRGESTNRVDICWSRALHSVMQLSPHEAACDGVWHFLTCVLVPDLVRWRWGGGSPGEVSDRWLTIRHRGRNCFGRLWWRAQYLFLPTGKENRYHLLETLTEDEMIQIMERPLLSGNLLLTRMIAEKHILFASGPPFFGRTETLREVLKRLLRLSGFIEYSLLDKGELQAVIDEAYQESIVSMEKTHE